MQVACGIFECDLTENLFPAPMLFYFAHTGNKSLLKLLPSLYASKSEPMYANIEGLVGVIATDTTTEEKTMLLELYLKIATAKPKV